MEQPAFVRNFLFQSGNASARGSAGMLGAEGTGQPLAAGAEGGEDPDSHGHPSRGNGQVPNGAVSTYLAMWQQPPRSLSVCPSPSARAVRQQELKGWLQVIAGY